MLNTISLDDLDWQYFFLKETYMKINKRIIFEIGFGVFNAACTVGAVATMHNAAIKANDILNSQENKEELATKDKVALTWKSYILPGTLTICSVGMTLVSSYCHITTLKQQLALLGVAGASAEKFTKLSNKVKEACGEETYNHMIEEIEAENTHDPYMTVGGHHDDLSDCTDEPEVLFYDKYSDSWFKAPKMRVKDAEYHLNRNFAISGSASVQEFYNFLGLDELYEKYKDSDIQWQVCDWIYHVDFIHTKRNKPDGTPYYEIIFEYDPQPGLWWDEYWG